MSSSGDPTAPGIATGVTNLDAMLRGGYPDAGTVLVRGDPGVGKSTFGMAFLRAGLDSDEQGLFIAPDRTEASVRRTMASLGIQDPASIAIASLRETVGAFLESASDATVDSIEGMLTQYGSPDRIVVDDVQALPRSGWADIDTDESARPAATLTHVLRRIAQVASEDIGATTLLLDSRVDDRGEGSRRLAGLVNGIVDIRWESLGSERGRMLAVEKMSSGDFDTRTLELVKHDHTLAVTGGEATVPAALTDTRAASTGIPGLDARLGGGLVMGAGVLLQHDGRVSMGPLYASLIAGAIERGHVVELVPTIHLREDRLRTLLSGFDLTLDELLEENRLFVFDMIGAWEAGQTNVFGAREELPEVRSMLTGIAERTGATHFRVVNADAMVHSLGVSDARRLRAFQESSLVGPDDQLLHVQNPEAVDRTAVAAYEDAAEQVVHIGFDDGGRQQLTVRKSPTGGIGSRAVLSFTEDPPYVVVGHVGESR